VTNGDVGIQVPMAHSIQRLVGIGICPYAIVAIYVHLAVSAITSDGVHLFGGHYGVGTIVEIYTGVVAIATFLVEDSSTEIP
jgi:hypothetical protein